MTSLALAPSPSSAAVEVLARVDALRELLAKSDLELEQPVSVRDQAALLHAYTKEGNLAADVAYQALDAKLRAERHCGILLERIIGNTPLAQYVRRPSGRPPTSTLAKLRQILNLMRSINTFQDAAELIVARQIASIRSSWTNAFDSHTRHSSH